jgi:hypothetical protein
MSSDLNRSTNESDSISLAYSTNSLLSNSLRNSSESVYSKYSDLSNDDFDDSESIYKVDISRSSLSTVSSYNSEQTLSENLKRSMKYYYGGLSTKSLNYQSDLSPSFSQSSYSSSNSTSNQISSKNLNKKLGTIVNQSYNSKNQLNAPLMEYHYNTVNHNLNDVYFTKNISEPIQERSQFRDDSLYSIEAPHERSIQTLFNCDCIEESHYTTIRNQEFIIECKIYYENLNRESNSFYGLNSNLNEFVYYQDFENQFLMNQLPIYNNCGQDTCWICHGY